MGYVVICFFFGLAGGVVGRLKGGSFFIWFLISAVLPIAGLIAALLYRYDIDEPRRRVPDVRADHQAPRREMHALRRGARVPRRGHCTRVGSRFPALIAPKTRW